MTWKEIKLAALQKIFSAEGNSIPTDDSVSDYLASMPQAVNEALQLLSTSGKFIIKNVQIAHNPQDNLIDAEISDNIQSIEEGTKEFYAERGRSYYFEINGTATVTIYVGDTLASTLNVSNKQGFKSYKGMFANEDKELVTVKFECEYPIAVKNLCIYSAKYETVEEVPQYSEYIRYRLDEMVDDYYMLSNEDVYFEGESGQRYINTSKYFKECDSVLVLPRSMKGNFTIYYKAYPSRITTSTADDYELPIDPEVAVLLPLYIASQIYKDDDISIATAYRNEFEVARELLVPRDSKGGAERFESESGWC